jgi:hypothetical protein
LRHISRADHLIGAVNAYGGGNKTAGTDALHAAGNDIDAANGLLG